MTPNGSVKRAWLAAACLALPACVPPSNSDDVQSGLIGFPTSASSSATTGAGGSGGTKNPLPLMLESLPTPSTPPDPERVNSTNAIRLQWAGPGIPALPIGTHMYKSTDNEKTWTNLGATGAASYFDDLAAKPNARNCYQLINQGTNDSSPIECAHTLDGYYHYPARIQVRVVVPDVAGADSKGPVRVRLQPNRYGNADYVIPNGNVTWLDSSAHDFTRNSNHTYDLMHTNIIDLSDITELDVENTGSDDLCISELELLVDVDTSADTDRRRLYYHNFGTQCTQAAGNVTVKADALDGTGRSIRIPFDSLRGTSSDANLTNDCYPGGTGTIGPNCSIPRWTGFQNRWNLNVSTILGDLNFLGFTQQGWSQMIEGLVGSGMVASGQPVQLRDGSPTVSSTFDQTEELNTVFIVVHELIDEFCTIPFNVKLQQTCDAAGEVTSCIPTVLGGTPTCSASPFTQGIIDVISTLLGLGPTGIPDIINNMALDQLQAMAAQASGQMTDLGRPAKGYHFGFQPPSVSWLYPGYVNGLSAYPNSVTGYCNKPACTPKCGTVCGISDGCGGKCGCGSTGKCCGTLCIANTQKCIPQ